MFPEVTVPLMKVDFPALAAIRLGYGFSPLSPPPQNPHEVLAGLSTVLPGPEAMQSARAAEMQIRLTELRRGRLEGKSEMQEFRAYNQMMGRKLARDLQRRIARAIDVPVGFGERLVQFWSDHFTVVPGGNLHNPLAIAFADEVIRPHVGGRFEDMFVAAETHPMMLIYLNQNSSRGPNSAAARRQPQKAMGLNENLAREAMELHSLGAGAPYSQNDVRELAELLTGLTYTARSGFAFNRKLVEPGAETVLGVNYGGQDSGDGLEDVQTALRDIARRPETASYLSRKLAVHFVSDNPSDDLVEAMAARWRETGGDLRKVYRVMITHPELAATLRQKVRQPLDYVVTALRALGVSGSQVMALDFPQLPNLITDPVARMGQRWFGQKGPDGWPEDAASWIAPQLLAARINWALTAPSKLLNRLPDPRELVGTALGGTQSEELAWAVPKAESRAEGVALILASGDFNRR